MKILDLKQRPEVLSLLADWHQSEWSYLNPGQTLDDRIKKMQAYLNDDFIPSTFVAIDKEVLGSAAIIESDMETRTDLSPWLASVYVAPEYRHQGIGSRLVLHVMKKAREQDFKKIYLYTPDQHEFYKQLGWQVKERELYHSVAVTIMEYCF